MERVLHVRGRVGLAPQTLGIALILGKQQVRRAVALQNVCTAGRRASPRSRRSDAAQRRLRPLVSPRPGVAEPQRRQQRSRAASGPRLCTVILTSTSSGPPLAYSTNTSKYRSSSNSPVSSSSYSNSSRVRWPFVSTEVPIREGPLRVLVEVLHVRVRGRAVDVEVVLLHILAMIAFGVGQSEQALLQDGILLVPQRDREAEALLVVADAAQAVLAPLVGPRARLLVREVGPRVAVARCSPRGRFPTAARSGRAPTSSTGCPARVRH